jgi:hypothetical protein
MDLADIDPEFIATTPLALASRASMPVRLKISTGSPGSTSVTETVILPVVFGRPTLEAA